MFKPEPQQATGKATKAKGLAFRLNGLFDADMSNWLAPGNFLPTLQRLAYERPILPLSIDQGRS